MSSAGALSAAGVTIAGRERAMRIPTISRARDILCSLVGSLPIRHYGTAWNGEELEEIPLSPEPWMLRPDSRTTRAHFLAWSTDSLIFYGRCYWYVTSRRREDGRPASFTLLDTAQVSLDAMSFVDGVPVGPYSLSYGGNMIPTDDVVICWSPIPPLLETGARSILIGERLDSAALRFATTPAAFGWLAQTTGEPLGGDELSELAAGWAEARDASAVAALGMGVEWHESGMDPSRLQLVEARQYQSLELARLANVPPYLVGAPAGTGMTYQNAETARQDAVTFGALPYIEAIEQTLSSDAVTPRGHIVRLDRSAWIGTVPAAPELSEVVV